CLTINGWAAPQSIYLHVGHLLADPASGRVDTDQTVIIAEGKVIEIRSGFQNPTEGVAIDLRDRFVLPGLIDTHVHILTQLGPSSELDVVKKSSADLALDGSLYALRSLQAGFTTLVDLGDDPEAIFALRDAIAAGKIDGPRIIAAGMVA